MFFLLRRQTLKNIKLTQALLDVVKEAGLTAGCPKQKGNLLYTVASKVGACVRACVRQQVVCGKGDSTSAGLHSSCGITADLYWQQLSMK